jgi:hypothetical protein
MLKFIFIFVSAFYLHADLLEDTVVNIIGENEYKKHKLLLNNEFKKKELFYIGENLKYKLVIKVLKDKGLLHLRYKNPQNVQIEIRTNSNSAKLLKIIKDVFANLGYAYYFTNSIEKENNNINWKISFNSIAMLDPYVFLSELENLEVDIIDAKKVNNNKWIYNIDLNYAKIPNTINISKNEKIVLKKPHKAYMLNVQNVESISIVSRKLNNWYPRIIMYDSELNILEMIEKDIINKKITVKVPQYTKYVLVDDTFTLLNIKRGLTVLVR